MQTLVIRSLTVGIPWNRLGPEEWVNLERFFNRADEICSRKGVIIRTKRITLPVLEPNPNIAFDYVRALIQNIVKRGAELGIRWFCLPISGTGRRLEPDIRDFGPALIKDEPRLFIHYLYRDYNDLDVGGLNEIAKRVIEISRINNNGFDNFRVGTGFNILANTPFFPFSWHDGSPAFSLAIESLAPVARGLRNGATDLSAILVKLCEEMEEIGREIEKVCDQEFYYRGQDISLAPYPDNRLSVAELMKSLGLAAFGLAGTPSVTNYLTSLLKSSLASSGARPAGFNGVMFSPLEDDGIASAMREREFHLDSFLLWSTLCGCGIDMIPVEGNVSASALAALYKDVSVISQKLSKPLGVRLLPIPNGRVNQNTRFNHDFLVNVPIVSLRGGFN